MTSNNALIPDPDKEDILASKPLDWPFLHLGLRMCGWGDNQTKFYLLGNPVNYWGGALSLIAFVVVLGIYLLRSQRRYVDMEPSEFGYHTTWKVNLLDYRGLESFPLRWQSCLRGLVPAFLYVTSVLFSESTADRSVVPFLAMGRVTYVHHYVRFAGHKLDGFLTFLRSFRPSILLSSCSRIC
jgi:dolichyl-phosphate-mannose-protein mannosyltransferase